MTSACSAIATALRAALGDNDTSALVAVGMQIQNLPPSDRQALLCSLSDGQTWGGLFSAALCRPEDKTSAWTNLAALTSIKPPPLHEFTVHFADASLLAELVDGLGPERSAVSRLEVCHCIRNLGRVPRLRSMLEDTIDPLVRTLSGCSSELAGAVSAALCNVACAPAGKEKAVCAVPVLLTNLNSAERPEIADDIVASIGVLTSNFKPGIEAVLTSGLGVAPLTKALRLGCPVPSETALEVLNDLTIGAGPSGNIAVWLSADVELVSKDLPRLVASSEPAIRTSALKLCALLLEFDSFRAGFTNGGGVDALRIALNMEPPAPPQPLSGKAVPKRAAGKMQFCNLGCADACCFGGVPGLNAQRPPSRREVVEELLQQLAN